MLVVDDVGLIKQGRRSVGVHRQYCGASGSVDNCQVAVDLLYAAPGTHRNADQKSWPLGMPLYLPEAWVNDAARRAEYRVPSEVAFKTKPEIALDLVDRARSHAVPHAWVVADAGYGDSSALREALRDRGAPGTNSLLETGLAAAPAGWSRVRLSVSSRRQPVRRTLRARRCPASPQQHCCAWRRFQSPDLLLVQCCPGAP